MEARTSSIYEFGRFRLEEHERVLFKTGREANAFEEYRKRDRSDAFDVARAKEAEHADDKVRAEYLKSGMTGFLRHRIEDYGTRCTGACSVLAKYYALLGDKEQALSGLEKSYEARDFLLPFVNTDPVFDDLRAEPRFQALLHRMGFGL